MRASGVKLRAASRRPVDVVVLGPSAPWTRFSYKEPSTGLTSTSGRRDGRAALGHGCGLRLFADGRYRWAEQGIRAAGFGPVRRPRNGSALDHGSSGLARELLDHVAATKHATSRSQAAWRDLADPQAEISTILGLMPVGEAMATSAFSTIAPGWDLAIATGQQMTELPEDLLAHARTVAQWIVPGLRAGEGHALFQPELPPPPDATPTQRLMAYLGRQPI